MCSYSSLHVCIAEMLCSTCPPPPAQTLLHTRRVVLKTSGDQIIPQFIVWRLCDSLTWDQQLWWNAGSRRWNDSGSYVTPCDRQTDRQADWQADRQTEQRVGCLYFHVVSALSVSPQDGLVQAAALREGLQRFLHQDRHQEGSQVSGGRVWKTRDDPAGMWLSRLEGHGFDPLHPTPTPPPSVSDKKKVLSNKTTESWLFLGSWMSANRNKWHFSFLFSHSVPMN